MAARCLVAKVTDEPEAGAAAWDYLQFSGYACLAWCWARMAKAAAERPEVNADDTFYEAKLATGRFYFARLLPRAAAHAAAARAGALSLG